MPLQGMNYFIALLLPTFCPDGAGIIKRIDSDDFDSSFEGDHRHKVR